MSFWSLLFGKLPRHKLEKNNAECKFLVIFSSNLKGGFVQCCDFAPLCFLVHQLLLQCWGQHPKTVFSNKGNSSVSDDVERAAPHCKFEWPKDQYSKCRKHVTAGPNKSRERKRSHPLSNLRLTVLFVSEETRSYCDYF